VPAETVQNLPSLSKRLTKQWRWIWMGLAVIVLVLFLRSGDLNLSRMNSSDGVCRIEVTADVLNVRAGPGTNNPVVQQLSRGTVVEATTETNSGFRKLGEGRWVASEFIVNNGNCGSG
jgi:uncharacterized protein YgiM (DUF1202 family)